MSRNQRSGDVRLRRWLAHLAPLPAVAVAAVLCAQVVLAPEPTSSARPVLAQAPVRRPTRPPRAAAPAEPAPEPTPAREAEPPPPVAATPPSAETPAPPAAATPRPWGPVDEADAADPERRLAAIPLLIEQAASDPAARRALERLLDDPEPRVAREAAYACAELPDGRSVLARRLWRGALPGLLELACIEGLARVGEPDDIRRLLHWSEQPGLAGELAADAIRQICRRAGLPPPPGLRPPAMEEEELQRGPPG